MVRITAGKLYGAIVSTFRVFFVGLRCTISHIAIRQTIVNQIHLKQNRPCNMMCYKYKLINPFTADPVKALHFAILV